jgi:hypothetical protein
MSITFDDTDRNVTKINCTAIETILITGLVNPDPISNITLALIQINTVAPTETINVSVRNGDEIKETMSAAKEDGLKIITIQDEATEYVNAFNSAIGAVNVITATPIIAMAQVCNFVSMPARFTSLVQDRLKFLESQFQRFLATIIGYTVNPAKKKLFEIQSASGVAAMCVAAVTPIGFEYRTAKSVFDVMNRIANSYNTTISTLDGLSVSEGGEDEYYVPSATISSLLTNCVNTTLANLLLIAINGKQERFVYTSEDTNAIILAHRYYGTSENDVNLDYFIETNNFRYDQLIGIKKGTRIVYYN